MCEQYSRPFRSPSHAACIEIEELQVGLELHLHYRQGSLSLSPALCLCYFWSVIIPVNWAADNKRREREVD